MYVVSGVSRSGTSLMMDCMVKAFGEDRIHGEKFPGDKRMEYLEAPFPDEDPHRFLCRMYLTKDAVVRQKERHRTSVDMNPQGFWESPYAVTGVYYRFQDRARLKEWETEDKPTICKIVCRGLWQSDPKYIDKLVYMIRHPRAVAKSQERLERNLPEFVDDEGGRHKLADMVRIHTPRMYIQVTAQACGWLVSYPEVPILHVYYDDLVEQPKQTFKRIAAFLGEGDFTEAVKSVKPKLRRSKPENIANTLWETAETVYSMFAEKNYQGVIDYVKDTKVDLNEGQSRFPCPRLGRAVVENECKACKAPKGARSQFKISAESRKVDWRAEPCMYDCGFGPGPYTTIEESIKNNSWSV